MPTIDWQRLQWYGVLAIGILFTTASFYILVAKHDPFAWIALSFSLAMVAMAAHDLWPWLIEGRPVSPDIVLQRFPAGVTLRTPRAKLIFFLVSTFLFGFSLGGVALYSDLGVFGKALMWIGAAGCAAAIPAFLLAILRGSTLRLDAQEMQIWQGLKTSRHRWADVSAFSVVDVGSPMVVFDDDRTMTGGRRRRAVQSRHDRTWRWPAGYLWYDARRSRLASERVARTRPAGEPHRTTSMTILPSAW